MRKAVNKNAENKNAVSKNVTANRRVAGKSVASKNIADETIADETIADGKTVNKNITQDETSLVAYSGIEEYLPTHALALPSKQDQALDDCAVTIAPSEWQTFASFQVEAQTKQVGGCSEQRLLVRNLNTGAIETWSKLETDVLQQWMVGQVREMLPPARVEISQVQILQSAAAGKLTIVGDRSLQSIRANQPFTVSFLIQFTEMQTAALSAKDVSAETMSCYVQCRARNLSTGTMVNLYNAIADFRSIESNMENCVAEAHASEPYISYNAENYIYQSQLFEFILPESGIYRLFFDLTLPGKPNLSASHRIPALKVI